MSDYQRLVACQDELLRDFLKQHISGRALKRLKNGGDIRVNQMTRTVRWPLVKGDVIELYYPSEKSITHISPWYFPLHVVYEDDYLMVIKKPAGIMSIPTSREPTHTLANIIVAYYKMHDIDATVHLVSRLDKDTSGLILVAKSARMHDLLSHSFERRYRLLVEGAMSGQGTIDAPIGRKEESIKRGVYADGKSAITHYRVLQTKADMSLVEAILETGRTHQIRVHFAYLGHPLIGDRLYGKAHPAFLGQALHSYYLSFTHPVLLETMTFEDIPEQFASI